MDDDTIADLKQFIAATMGQQLAEFEARFDDKLNKLDIKIDKRADEILSAVADVITANTDDLDARLDDHEKRLRRLEHKPA